MKRCLLVATVLVGSIGCSAETTSPSEPVTPAPVEAPPPPPVGPPSATPAAPAPATQAPTWSTRTAKLFVELTRTGETGGIVATFHRDAAPVAARPRTGTCIAGAAPDARAPLANVGELQIDPPGRGQGIIILPDSTWRYAGDLPEEVLRPEIVTLSARGGELRGLTYDILWPARPPLDTVVARRVSASDAALTWSPAEGRTVVVSTRDGAGALVTCAFDGAVGRGTARGIGDASSLRTDFVVSLAGPESVDAVVDVHDRREVAVE